MSNEDLYFERKKRFLLMLNDCKHPTNELINLKKCFYDLKDSLKLFFKDNFHKINHESDCLIDIIKYINTNINKDYAIKDRNKFSEADNYININNTCIFQEHPLQKALFKIDRIFTDLSFNRLDSDVIVSEYENFDFLLIFDDHPARKDVDTFIINNDDDDKKFILRSHATTCQSIFANYIKNDINNNNSINFPIKVFSIGRVFRRDNDKTHLPSFHQLDAFLIGKNISVKDLFFNVKYILNKFFNNNVEIRVRSSFFPFTNPSFEIDLSFNNKWIEVAGCGLIDKAIINSMGLNSNKYNGFAFGFGIERLIMCKNNIKDIKLLINTSIKDI